MIKFHFILCAILITVCLFSPNMYGGSPEFNTLEVKNWKGAKRIDTASQSDRENKLRVINKLRPNGGVTIIKKGPDSGKLDVPAVWKDNKGSYYNNPIATYLQSRGFNSNIIKRIYDKEKNIHFIIKRDVFNSVKNELLHASNMFYLTVVEKNKTETIVNKKYMVKTEVYMGSNERYGGKGTLFYLRNGQLKDAYGNYYTYINGKLFINHVPFKTNGYFTFNTFFARFFFNKKEGGRNKQWIV